MNRKKDKIKQLQQYTKELQLIMPKNIEEYKELKNKAACERYVERIAESTIDLIHLIIKEKQLQQPEHDGQAIQTLEKANIITNKTSKKIILLKGMRNVIAHQYDDLNDEIIYETIKKEIHQDIKQFIQEITSS